MKTRNKARKARKKDGSVTGDVDLGAPTPRPPEPGGAGAGVETTGRFIVEVPIRRALNAGTLVVAAAGNNADRPMNPGFVEPPANSDGAVAVAALDSQLRIARFSSRSSTLTGVGGKVNVAGPGVDVFSSVPVGRGTHAAFNGTSMATPHVAGIAALWSQASGLSGAALWNRLIQTVRPLSIASADIGAGLVQAPQ